nr:MAG: ORF1 [TTV-like mini virus]
MPWRYYRRRWRWRPRPWWSYRRGARKTFRTRWRPRRRRVRKYLRKKKLSKIHIQQYQPRTIRKCRIKGLLCLIYFNMKRLWANSVMYENAIVPELKPGGGGFSVIKLTLEGMYDMFLRCHNWWTYSNQDLPLVRYTGCKLKLYQSEKTDYVFKYTTTLPGKSNELTYPACQPSVMMMSKHSIIVPSTNTKKRRKPYKTVHIKPPPQLQTKWYFQTDLNKTPLVTLYTAACSLQHYYLGPKWDSQNTTITHLNTTLIQNPNFAKFPADTGYSYKTQGTQNYYFWATIEPHNVVATGKLKKGYLIPLTDTKNFVRGAARVHSGRDITYYKQHWQQFAGNPFTDYEENEIIHLYATKSPKEIFTASWSSDDEQIDMTEMGFQQLTEPLILKTRYNPNRDQGTNNKIYLVSNQQNGNWDTPTDNKTLLTGLPIWLGLFGFTDFKKKQNIIGVDEQNILCFQTKSTLPQFSQVFVPIGFSFLKNLSPYQKEPNRADWNKWYPQVQFQEEMINSIVSTGPGTSKIDNTADEIKCEYTMYFKWGGDPAKMLQIENPAHQDYYPIPSTEQQTTSLQNPAMPPEYFLYAFDERKGTITTRAAKRIKKDIAFKESLFQSTGSAKEVPAQTSSSETSETSDSEKEEETLQQQLLNQQLKQQQLRQRIKQLKRQVQHLT